MAELERLWEECKDAEVREDYWDEEDTYDLECGFNPYEGCYDWDC